MLLPEPILAFFWFCWDIRIVVAPGCVYIPMVRLYQQSLMKCSGKETQIQENRLGKFFGWDTCVILTIKISGCFFCIRALTISEYMEGFWFLPVDLDAKIPSKTQKSGGLSQQKSYDRFMALCLQSIGETKSLNFKAHKFLKFVFCYFSWCFQCVHIRGIFFGKRSRTHENKLRSLD